ncbi:hypothetical protein D9M71_795120 [compost metagenome]
MTTESNWNTEILPNPKAYRGATIDRYQSANAPFDQMISDGVTWKRIVVSSQYKGERSTIPTSLMIENAGSYYDRIGVTVEGTAGSRYMVVGWRTTGGGAWLERRELTGT